MTKPATSIPLEPGFLMVFRIFNAIPSLGAVGFIIALIFPNALIQYYSTLFPGLISAPFISYVLVSDALKLIFLFWPHLPKKLKGYYLPIGIVLGTLTPLLRAFFVLHANPMWFYEHFPREVFQAYFVVPLIFIAWQYSFRSILIYCAFLVSIEVYTYVQLSHLDVSLLAQMQSSMLLIGSNLFIGYVITSLVSTQRQQQEQLSNVNRQLLRYTHTLEQLAESRERNRLARELHDTLAHYMSGTILQLNGAQALWSKNNPEAQSMLIEAIQTLTQGLDETRKAIQTLRKSSVETLGITESLKELAKQYTDKLGLELTLNLEAVNDLPETASQGLYYMAQETLRNIERHAKAKHLSVTLKKQGRFLLLAIEDDGIGFEIQSIDRTQHFGLLGLEERVALLGGDVSIHSRPGQGTTVEVRLPREKS